MPDDGKAYVANARTRAADAAIALAAGGGVDMQPSWIDIEDGVQVAFPSGHNVRIGDYWLVAARTETGDVEWPRDNDGSPIAVPPMGIDYAFAPLAIVRPAPAQPLDLRRQFKPLAVVVP
jgi:hypothetical protein